MAHETLAESALVPAVSLIILCSLKEVDACRLGNFYRAIMADYF